MNIRNAAGLAIVALTLTTNLASAQQYVDVNGATAGFGDYVYTSGGNGSGGMYNFVAPIFTTDAAGTTATTTFVSGTSVVYDTTSTTGNFAVRLPGDINPNRNFNLGGLSLINNPNGYTLAFNNGFFYANSLVFNGGTIQVANGQIRINDRNNVTGNYVKTGTGSLMINSRSNGFGAPPAYSGTATISAGSVIIASNVATDSGSHYKLNGGSLQFGQTDTNALGNIGLGVISGTGSVLSTSGTTLNIAVAGLDAGASVGTSGTIAFGLNSNTLNTLDVSGVAAGKLMFDLGTSSDKITMTLGTLNVGTLDFSDFSFNGISGFAAGVYTLFDTTNTILGSIGTASGSIGGLTGTLSFANSNQDVILTVTGVPEPTTCALLVLGGMVGLLKRKRHARN